MPMVTLLLSNPVCASATLPANSQEHGLELAGSHDLMSRTVGGAVAGACIGPAFGDDGAFFASQVKSIRVITPNGKSIEIRPNQHNLLNTFR